MTPGVLTVGSTHRFTATLQKDGVAWDLSAASVELVVKDPEGELTSLVATVVLASAGTVRCDNAASLFDRAGDWSRAWRVTDGTVTDTTDPINFEVIDSP